MDNMEQMPVWDGTVPDQQLLERVWARVMQGREPAVQPLGDGEDGATPEQVSAGIRTEERQDTWQEPPTQGQRPEPGCFGRTSRTYAEQLERMLEGEWEDAHIYRQLTRRGTGQTARELSRLARQEQAHARKLAAAYFILTGRHRRWSGQGQSRPPVELMQGLREQLLQALRESEAYRQAGAETEDMCLRELFYELSEQEREQAGALRRILEQM